MTQPDPNVQMTPPADGAVPDAAVAQPTPVPAPQPAPTPEPAPVVADPPPTPTDSQVVSQVAADPAPEVVEEPGTAVALADRFDVAQAGEQWPHQVIEFKGDSLGIRIPQRQALAAFSLATSKYVALGVKNDLTGLFIARHLSPESYGRVFSRLMDPDEADYTVDTVGELFNAIVTAAVDADKADDAG